MVCVPDIEFFETPQFLEKHELYMCWLQLEALRTHLANQPFIGHPVHGAPELLSLTMGLAENRFVVLYMVIDDGEHIGLIWVGSEQSFNEYIGNLNEQNNEGNMVRKALDSALARLREHKIGVFSFVALVFKSLFERG